MNESIPRRLLVLLATCVVPVVMCACDGDGAEDDISPDMNSSRDLGGMDQGEFTGDQGNAPQDQSNPLQDQGDVSRDQEGDAGCQEPEGAVHVSVLMGDDGATGTVSTPFATIERAMQDAQSGSSVIVHKGTYAESVTFTRSGSQGSPIILRAACGVRPVLDGSLVQDSDSGLPALIKIIDQSFITVQGFELRGLTSASRDHFPSAIWVRGASHHISLIDNVIHAVSAFEGGDQSGAHGLAIYGTSTSPAHDILVQGNELYDLTLGWSEALVVNGNVRDFTVMGNDVHDVDNIAYDFIGFEADVCPACVQDDVVDVDNVNRVRRGLITQNTASNVSSFGNPAYGEDKSAGCFYVDGGAQLIIDRNIASRCDIGVELASEAFGKSTREIIVRHNVLFDHDVTAIATGGYDSGNGAGGGSAKDCVIIHNTIVNSSVNGWANTSVLLQHRNVGNLYQNNIILSTSGMAAILDGGDKNEGNVFSHNVYQGELDGVEAGEGSLDSLVTFVDAASGDYSLASGSPGVNAGVALPTELVGELDFAGDARVQGVVDIGAFEQ